ncbi:glycosyltransferase family 2 protein [Actinomycetospora sp. TBRC 11914]|nr:glycosyltransferase family 2 protein [Actinomycetospora sp. TBRC 11914]
MRPSTPSVSVIVPTRNEAANLPIVLGQVPGHYEVVIVDGNSVDDTVEVARRCRPDARIILQTRKGKGNALACGFAAATGDVIVMLDADGSADPAEIPVFLDALVAGADYAKGSRFAEGGDSDDITVVRALGNRVLTGMVNRFFGVRYTDLCYGYNAFWSSLVPVFGLPDLLSPSDGMVWGDGFEIETLINIRVAAAAADITEVGSVERTRIHGESNLNATSDGLRVLHTILVERWRLTWRRPALPAVAVPDTVPELVGPTVDSLRRTSTATRRREVITPRTRLRVLAAA